MIEPLAVPISEACRIIGCQRTKFYQLLNEKEIVRIKVGNRSLVPIASLRDFVARKMTEARQS